MSSKILLGKFLKEFKKISPLKLLMNKIDFIAIFPFQGPKQNGMPELHNLTPSLTILQKRGFKKKLNRFWGR